MSQIKLAEMIHLSPNYLNAVENGKNFPSPEVIQNIADVLEILPYQLFLELPSEREIPKEGNAALVQELTLVKQKFSNDLDSLISRYT